MELDEMDKELIMRHVQQSTAEEFQGLQITTLSKILEEQPPEGQIVEEQEVIEGEVVENPAGPKTPIFQRRIRLHWLIVFALSASLITTLIMLFLEPLFTASAIVTLVPNEKLLAFELTMQLPSTHLFPSYTLTKTKTVPTTGVGHQDATQAQGTVTFYNAAPFIQTIDAGTLLIGSDGAHIVTDEIAYIPGANAPLEGQLTVTAHSLNIGSQGNIAAYDVNEHCCRDNIFVKNLSAFAGGGDARDYQMVSKADINNVSAMLQTNLKQFLQASFMNQLQPSEVLIPPQCSLKTVTDHIVGQEAKKVVVTVMATCSAAAYNLKAFQKQARDAFLSSSLPSVGDGYTINGNVQTSIVKMLVSQGILAITFHCTGKLVYRFSQRDKQVFAKLISGKDVLTAIKMLLRSRGVDRAMLTVSRQGADLPTDYSRISIVVLDRGM